ncbi:MAG: hypothetical protein Unbinned4512contig1001_16 [Prokaryotic dsDNA virus sp.]|nr:MAG: hypothetical protein Unbinned4512contig1001_16 [Prokaryotic dsDNA virus sp.]|tara:strand:+ start:626 stop:1006 length:381 start_codon:yes stop_codon:yes gene_type:complete
MAEKKEINLEKVEKLAAIGLSEQQIAESLGISRSTITRRKRDDDAFAAALRAGKAAGIAAVTNALFEAATGEKPNTSAQIFYLKNRAGWKDKQDIDANLTGDVTLNHDVEAAMQAVRDAGLDPLKL